MNFKTFYHLVKEQVEVDLTDKEKKFLTYLVNIIMGFVKTTMNTQAIINGNFGRIFNFDPNREGKEYIGNFAYYLLEPKLKMFTQDELKKIETILGIRDIDNLTNALTRYDTIDLDEVLPRQLSGYDKEDQLDKGIRIMGIVFNAVGRNFAEQGHKGWQKLLYRKNLNIDTETDQAWGNALSEL
jgi:hypothetical protein